LLESGTAGEKELQAIRDEIKIIVDDAVKFAEESPEPPLEELYTDVYTETNE
jgi:pyruvate dehydrogenase E1 component alpha subunit